MIGFLKPPAHREALPEGEVEETYRRLRLQVFIGIFVGYAGYYLVRKNFTLAMPYARHPAAAMPRKDCDLEIHRIRLLKQSS